MTRDPRTLWVSDDGEWAVACHLDIPEGVAVGLYYRVSTSQSLQLAIDSLPGTYANSYGESVARLCKVRRLDLPWEREPQVVIYTHPVVNRVFTIPMARRVPDWPLRCPKCQRPDAAVLLFQTYDCKHGCYRPDKDKI